MSSLWPFILPPLVMLVNQSLVLIHLSSLELRFLTWSLVPIVPIHHLWSFVLWLGPLYHKIETEKLVILRHCYTSTLLVSRFSFWALIASNDHRFVECCRYNVAPRAQPETFLNNFNNPKFPSVNRSYSWTRTWVTGDLHDVVKTLTLLFCNKIQTETKGF